LQAWDGWRGAAAVKTKNFTTESTEDCEKRSKDITMYGGNDWERTWPAGCVDTGESFCFFPPYL